MTDQSQGEGWWQASDGKWYPPPRPDLPGDAPTDATPPVTQQFGPPPGAPPVGPPTAPMGGPAYGPPTGPPGAPVGPPGTPPGAPAKSGIGRGPIIAIAAAALIVIAAIVFFVTRDDGKKEDVAATKTEQSDQTDRSDNTDNKSSSSSSNAQGKTPSGFKVIKDDAEGASIAVPKDFTEIDPSAFVNSSNDSDFSSLNPELAPFLQSGNAFLNGAVLAAAGSSNGTPSFVVVAKSPQNFDVGDASFQNELESELKAAGATNVTLDTVTLPAGDALRVGVTLGINTGTNSGTVNETLFFVNVGRTTWVVVGASVGDSSNSDLFDQIAQTLAVTA
jgi:hypothetical protein